MNKEIFITEPCNVTIRGSPPYLNRDFWNKRSKFWKWHCFRKMALESKRFHQNHWSWYHFAGKRIFYSLMYSLMCLVPDFFEIIERRCCVLSGPPCITLTLIVLSFGLSALKSTGPSVYREVPEWDVATTWQLRGLCVNFKIYVLFFISLY